VPMGTEQARLTIPVADGCGFNRYRDARGICRKKYVITRHQGRQPVYTGCGGLNSHRVCNLYGHCWMVCDWDRICRRPACPCLRSGPRACL